MTIQDRLSEIEERAEKARAVYNMHSPEHRYIALANYTMGEEYIADVPKLVSALRVSVDKFKEITNTIRLNDPNNYLAEHFKELSKQALTEIERILEGK